MESMSMSALESDDDDDDMDDVLSPGAIKQTTIRSRSNSSSLPNGAATQAQVATHLGRRMSDAMLTSPVDVDVNPAGEKEGTILKEPQSREPVRSPQVASPPLSPPNSFSPTRAHASPLASPNDLAAQLYANPKLTALRGASGSGIESAGTASGSGGATGASPRQQLPVSPPILMNPKCSGYFVEPMQWMEPFLETGDIAGKIVCPNKKCGAKLGNYDWAGVCCGCKEWVVPGFCISRSKVDEIVA